MMNIGNAEIIEDVFRSFTSVMVKTIVAMGQTKIIGQEVGAILSGPKGLRVKLAPQVEDRSVQEETRQLISEQDHQMKNQLPATQMINPFNYLKICSK